MSPSIYLHFFEKNVGQYLSLAIRKGQPDRQTSSRAQIRWQRVRRRKTVKLCWIDKHSNWFIHECLRVCIEILRNPFSLCLARITTKVFAATKIETEFVNANSYIWNSDVIYQWMNVKFKYLVCLNVSITYTFFRWNRTRPSPSQPSPTKISAPLPSIKIKMELNKSESDTHAERMRVRSR